VLAVSYRAVDRAAAVTAADEHDLVLDGVLTFFDPPSEGVAESIAALGNVKSTNERDTEIEAVTSPGA
jgi:magnesium-transporting ATPase (P-type)